MSDKFFIDTDNFIYSFDSNNPDKQSKANDIIKKLLERRMDV